MVDSVSVRFKNARVEKMALNIRVQWNAGTACVSECAQKPLACRGLRVGPSKGGSTILKLIWGGKLLCVQGFGDYETWKFRICSESVSGVFPDLFRILLWKC